VDDDATREVMTRFYVLLRDSAHTDKLEALRQAQLALLHFEKEGKHPYAAPFHWAAFELIGDFR
jgi:CHAT domain-containing protein